MSYQSPFRRSAIRTCSQLYRLPQTATNSPSACLLSQRLSIQKRPVHDSTTKRVAVETTEDALLNPPRTTRPPPLSLPSRDASESQIKYLFQLGKAYLTFLKDGFKSVNENRKLLRAKYDRTPKEDRPSIFRPSYVPNTFSRADWLLMWRTRHDLLRIPAFGLLVIVTGELSVIIAAAVDGLVPYPCKIPSHTFHAQERAEARRRRAFDQLEASSPDGPLSANLSVSAARNHALRSMYISGDIWEHLHFLPPGMWQVKGALRMMFVEGDDKNLIRDGGVTGLIHEEVKLACIDRGIDVLGRSGTDLRAALGDWLRLTATEDIVERRKRMTVLLLTR